LWGSARRYYVWSSTAGRMRAARAAGIAAETNAATSATTAMGERESSRLVEMTRSSESPIAWRGAGSIGRCSGEHRRPLWRVNQASRSPLRRQPRRQRAPQLSATTSKAKRPGFRVCYVEDRRIAGWFPWSRSPVRPRTTMRLGSGSTPGSFSTSTLVKINHTRARARWPITAMRPRGRIRTVDLFNHDRERPMTATSKYPNPKNKNSSPVPTVGIV
jgi:hypothetical protein